MTVPKGQTVRVLVPERAADVQRIDEAACSIRLDSGAVSQQ